MKRISNIVYLVYFLAVMFLLTRFAMDNSLVFGLRFNRWDSPIVMIALMSLISFFVFRGIGKGEAEHAHVFLEARRLYFEHFSGVNAATLLKYIQYEQEEKRRITEERLIFQFGMTPEEIKHINVRQLSKKYNMTPDDVSVLKQCRIAILSPQKIYLQMRKLDRFIKMKNDWQVVRRVTGRFYIKSLIFILFKVVVLSLFTTSIAFTPPQEAVPIGNVITKLGMSLFTVLTSSYSGHKFGYRSVAIFLVRRLRVATFMAIECEEYAKIHNLPYKYKRTDEEFLLNIEKKHAKLKSVSRFFRKKDSTANQPGGKDEFDRDFVQEQGVLQDTRCLNSMIDKREFEYIDDIGNIEQ